MQQLQQNANAIGRMIAAMFLVILGGTNVFLNAGLLLRGHPGNWLPALPWIVIFGFVPIGLGAWLLLRRQKSSKSEN